MNNSNYVSIGYFVQKAIIILSTPPYFEIVDNVFNFIETDFTDEERDVVISMLAKRIDDIENIDSKARLLKFIQDHRKDDCDGPEIVLK
jgi:hypothetical protein